MFDLKDISRTVLDERSGRSFTLNIRFGPRRWIFGLIIGIDEYKSPEILNLKGCKNDAQSIFDLLINKFHVPASHILFLTNEKATRNAIISGFRSHFIQNGNIEHDDAMFVFYAGHGSQIAAPNGWVRDGSKIETICPHDERTVGWDGKKISGIPDRTIDGLLRMLASTKGDNIVCSCLSLSFLPSC